MIESVLLRRIKEEQHRYAVEALMHPNFRDSYEYGYHVGTVACYERVANLLLTILDEEKNGNPDL
jgi:hypothetical protein